MGALIGGVLGMGAGAKGNDAANAALQAALQQFGAINVPDIASQQLSLQDYLNAGNFTPEQIQAQQMGQSAMAGIQTDPRLVQAQMAALNQLSQVGQMGMTPAEAAALQSATMNAQAQAQAKSKQIQDLFARTGMGGSGAQLAAQLENAQGEAQQLGTASNQVAQSAQQQALQAISQAGLLGGQMNAQQFGQQAEIARAKDYINQFNTMNSQNVQNQNVQANNQAALRNLLNQQNISNQNTQLANQQQQYNKQLLQQQFNDQMQKAAGMSGQYKGIADQAMTNAANVADSYAGIGKGVDTAAGSLYNYFNNSGGGSAAGLAADGSSLAGGMQGLADSGIIPAAEEAGTFVAENPETW